MVRSPTIVVALALSASVALAQPEGPSGPQPAPPDGDQARFQFTRVEDGYLRLDLRTGQVSLCSRRTVGWSCLTVADDRAALEQEIGRLQSENVALKKVLLARGVPLPDGVTPADPGPGSGEGAFKSPSNAEVDRMVSAIQRVWQRLLEMVGRLQKGMTDKTPR